MLGLFHSLWHTTAKSQNESSLMSTGSTISDRVDDFCNFGSTEARVRRQPCHVQHWHGEKSKCSCVVHSIVFCTQQKDKTKQLSWALGPCSVRSMAIFAIWSLEAVWKGSAAFWHAALMQESKCSWLHSSMVFSNQQQAKIKKRTLSDMSLNEMDVLWEEAKHQ